MVRLSFSYALVSDDPTSSVLPPKPTPPPYEVSRRVLASGTVLRYFSDGSVCAYYRNANVSVLAVSGEHAGCWLHTNAAGN